MKIKTILLVISIIFTASCSTSQAPQEIKPPNEASPRVASQKSVVIEPLPEKKIEAPTQTQSEPQPTLLPPPQAPAISAPEIGKPEGRTAEEIPYSPKIVESKSNIDIILDTSGSMTGATYGSSLSKFDVLKDALFTILNEVTLEGTPRNIGIRRLGKGCSDTTQIYQMGSINISEIKKQIDKITPEGESAIYDALQSAKSDFPATMAGEKVILIIADGADTCGHDLCSLAKTIVKDLGGAIIEVIGFDLNEKDISQLECLTNESSGKFWHARNPSELFSYIEEAINIGVPYNLKLKVSSGATPIPCKISIYKAGTEMVIKEAASPGIKHFSLTPGSYDIKIEYTQTKEATPPAKVIKSVDILEGSKIEQKVEFELAPLALSALDENEKSIQTKFEIVETGKDKIVATIEQSEPSTYFFTPGIYDIKATRTDMPEGYAIEMKGVEISPSSTQQNTFKFQPGVLKISGKSFESIPVQFTCRIFKENDPTTEIMQEQITSEGREIKLLPGKYRLVLTADDTRSAIQPKSIIDVEVLPAQQSIIEATFPLVNVVFSATVSNQPLPARFIISDQKTGEELGKIENADGKPMKSMLPPGEYQIKVESTRSMNEPKPFILLSNIKAVEQETKPLEISAKFIFGGLRLRGRDSKERPMPAQFSVYKGGSDELVVEQTSGDNWLLLDLSPATYDVTASKLDSPNMPTVRLNDIKLEEGKTTSHEAIFTSGKIKLIARGPNNALITCHFKIFEYGADRELINGLTGNDWQSYEIEPGKYYIEASYHDPDLAVTLKKWVNISIGENEIVEKVLRF